MPRPEEQAKTTRGCWASTTRLEKILIGLTSLLSIVIVIVLIFLVAKKQADFTLKYCNTSVCLSEASKISEFIDRDVNPCDDFYQFACGNFLKHAHGDEKLALSYQLDAQGKRELFEAYVEPIQEDDHKMVKTAKKLFRACMNETEIERDNVKTLKEVIRALGGWPVVEGPRWNEANFDWIHTSYQIRGLGFHYSVFLELSVETDVDDESKKIFKVATPDMWDYSNRNFDKVEFMAEVAEMFGAKDREIALEEMKRAHAFLIQLQMEIHKTYHQGKPSKFTVEQYQQECNSVKWLEFINNIAGPSAMVSKKDFVSFPPPKTLNSWIEVISKTPKRTQANYMMWKVIEASLPYLTEDLRNRDGRNRLRESRNEFCLWKIQERFIPSPIDITCDRKYVSKEKKKQLEELVMNIKSKLVEVVENAEWMDKKDKETTVEKVKAIQIMIGQAEDYFDDKILDDLDVDMIETKSNTFLSLLAQADRNRQTAVYKQVKKTTSENLEEKWYMRTGGLPFYSEEDNFIYISAISAQNFLYNQNRSNYLNYGAIGTQLGYQFTGLLTRYPLEYNRFGSQFEWSNHTKEEGEKKTKCVEKDMEFYKLRLDRFDIGFVIQKSIADQLSYGAYQNWVKKHGQEQHLIGTDYTPNQLFWISTAPMYCQPMSSYSAAQRSLKDPSQISVLVSGSVRHNPQFAKDFNCPKGSRMNPSTKCPLI